MFAFLILGVVSSVILAVLLGLLDNADTGCANNRKLGMLE